MAGVAKPPNVLAKDKHMMMETAVLNQSQISSSFKTVSSAGFRTLSIL